MTTWYDKEAKTALDRFHSPQACEGCICDSCVQIREELPAQRIERHLRTIILDLDGMTGEELDCVHVHLQDLRGPGAGRSEIDFLDRTLANLGSLAWHLSRKECADAE